MPVYKQSIIDQLLSEDWDFPTSNKQEGLHSIHPYPGKFIPEIPRSLIRILDIPKDRPILDPFCGSGVTLTEAQNAGYEAVGIDINPIGCLISRVKTHPLPSDLWISGRQTIEDAVRISLPFIPNIPNLNHWFNEEVIQSIARLITVINHQSNAQIKDCLRLALSSILVRVSNQDSDTRYAAVNKESRQKDVSILFITAVQKLCKVLSTRNPTNRVVILEGDILQCRASELPKNIGAVITSPPYPNAYEYWLYHKYRMFWLGYNPQAVKEKEIGARAHYFKKSAPASDHFLVQLRQIFGLFSEVVAEGGYVCMVVGRSKIHGQIIDNAAFVEQAASAHGFEKLAVVQRRISNSRKSFNLAHAAINHEHILVFQR